MLVVGGSFAIADNHLDGWQSHAPRDELRPAFAYHDSGGPDNSPRLVIEHDHREGLHGYWAKTFPVEGGRHYRFSAVRLAQYVESPRRSVIARVLWRDDDGRNVPDDRPVVENYLNGWSPRAEAEYPFDRDSSADDWTGVSGNYRAPAAATQAIVELHLQWAPGGKVTWSSVSLAPVDSPVERKVRLAAVHYQPKAGKTPKEKREQFAPLVAEAAKQGADLVVLPETLTRVLRQPRQGARPVHRRGPRRAG
jgi:hypothetical protein